MIYFKKHRSWAINSFQEGIDSTVPTNQPVNYHHPQQQVTKHQMISLPHLVESSAGRQNLAPGEVNWLKTSQQERKNLTASARGIKPVEPIFFSHQECR
ncbi:hypothetical protein JTE90_008879 [Oedothorax gibbosus]|uniref:Uncharacterized protein n=1 Tax=Oedothorax gibbosus TaxID=931172 RepID=A0AAV6TIC1_9ARAC|nr:hypothetical protein JTE90_008879 [Oedothorax gibbosus]